MRTGLLTLALVVAGLGFGRVSAAAQPEVVLELPPSETNCRNSEGDFAVLKDGSLLFVYSHYVKGSGGDHDPAHLASRLSRDGGRTWSATSEKVIENEGGMNVMCASFLRLKDGSLALFYLRKNSEADCRPMMRVSRDEGKTWGPPVLCVPDADVDYYVLENCRAERLKSGRIILPMSLHASKDGKIVDWAGKLVCAVSDDDGATWRLSGKPIATCDAAGKRLATQEPGIVQLKDGRLLMYARTDRGRQWFYYSSDDGDTWTKGEPGTLWGPLAPATVKRLSNGDLVAVWNDHETRPEFAKAGPAWAKGTRRPLSIAVSRDEGRTWIHRQTLEDRDDGWFCYFGVLEHEGHLLLGYCAEKMLRHARLMRVPLAWLYGEEPTTGKVAESPESRYLLTKWRKDSGDPATGLNGPALRAELEKHLPQWTREGSWTMTKAKAFCFLCDRTAIDVSDLDWFPAFALWTRHTPKLHPLQEILARRDREVTAASLPAGLARPQGPRWCGYHDYDHSAPDWDVILPLGFTGLAARLAAHDDGSEYYVARKLAMAGIFRFLDRLVAKGRTVPGARARQQTESIARLRQGPPVTALDALQFIYLYWTICEKFEMIQVRTLGNLDKILTPYYRADLAAGRTTEAEFRAELRHFWWQWGSIDNYYGQPVYFGGTKADGTTEYNEVSKILLEVHDELALPTPKVHLKMGKSTPDWVWRQTLEMMRRQRPLSFVGEEPHGRVIRAMGYDEDCARTFMLWGCYEWAVRDSANDTCAAQVNLLHPVTALLADAAAGRFAAETFDDFKAAYLASVGATVSAARDFAFENEKSLAEVNPALLFSVATEYSVKTGRDAYQGGTAHGNNSAIWMVGTGTSVDALLAVKELVYERRELTLADLGKVLAANWKGCEELRLRMRRSHRKWGNNDPEANRLARELQKHVASLVNGRPNSRGGVFKACGHTARWHVMMGKGTGATPDGRKAGEEISKNISPTMGADTEGVTALLASVANLDAKDYPGDFPLDVALLPSTVAGEKGLALMRTVVETYFDNGGLVIQFNLHDPRVLRDAQKHPEKYANLQVRITGWNVRWNDLPKVEQDRFIERAERIGQ